MSSVGKTNLYVCSACRGRIITIDRDDGVTPFMILCKVSETCHGTMQSNFYRVPPGMEEPSYEWYKPKSLAGLSPGERGHVQQGGLVLRKIGGELRRVLAFSPSQRTPGFRAGAPQRESYQSDEDHFKACDAYAEEWKKKYVCAGCKHVDCPQCGEPKGDEDL